MPEPNLHPPQSALDLFAEGALAPEERGQVASHLALCRQCEAEVEACRAVIQALGALPRLEPSAEFADAVMARVRIAPASHAARVRRLLPATRRGWLLIGSGAAALCAPAMLLLAWIWSQPLLTVGGLGFWLTGRIRELAWASLSRVASQILDLGAADGLSDLIRAFAGLPGATVAGIAVGLIVLVPLSGWSLVRLARTSSGGFSHAH